jgi:hypothetical protein
MAGPVLPEKVKPVANLREQAGVRRAAPSSRHARRCSPSPSVQDPMVVE